MNTKEDIFANGLWAGTIGTGFVLMFFTYVNGPWTTGQLGIFTVCNITFYFLFDFLFKKYA